jgi:hypothetical protein
MAPKINDPLALIQYLQNSGGGGSNPPSASSQLNYTQDILSSLFNPQFAAAYGMFDPVGLAPAPFDFATPVLTGALNSATPVWREIAQQISDGTIDRQNAISAVAETLGVDEYSTGAGLNLKSIETDIDSMFNEIGDKQNAAIKYQSDMREAEQGNIYGKAGLRQPYEQYTLQDAPFSQNVFDQQSELEKMIQSLSLRGDKQRQAINTDTQAIYTKMMEQDQAAQDAIPDRFMPESWADAKALAETLGVDEGWMKDIYDKSFGLGTVQVYDQEKQKYVNKTFTPAEKQEAFKNFIRNEVNKGTSGTGSPIGDWLSGNADERGVKVSNYLKAGKPLISGARKEDADQAGRRGMAMSMEAAKKSKAKNTDRYLAADRFAKEAKARELDIQKLAELQNLIDAGRTPLQDQLTQRAALFGLGNNL